MTAGRGGAPSPRAALRPAAFPVLGRAFRARGAPPELERWLRHHWHRPEHALPAHAFRIGLRVAADAPAPPPPSARAVPLPEIGLPCRVEGDRWWIGRRRGGVRLRLTPGRARIRVWGLRSPEGARLYPALFLALCEALRASGLVSLHASVVAQDGVATAFLGPSGTGKSTTLLRAVRAGWSPLAEDFAWVDPESGVAYGWDHGLSLWPGSCARFAPELAGAGWCERGDGKRFLPWDALPAPRARQAVLGRVVRLERDADGAGGWEPLPRARVVGGLWESVGRPLSSMARRGAVRAVGVLAERVAGRRLVLGEGEEEIGRFLAEG